MDLGLLALLIMAEKECGPSDGSGCLIGCVIVFVAVIGIIVILHSMGGF